MDKERNEESSTDLDELKTADWVRLVFLNKVMALFYKLIDRQHNPYQMFLSNVYKDAHI